MQERLLHQSIWIVVVGVAPPEHYIKPIECLFGHSSHPAKIMINKSPLFGRDIEKGEPVRASWFRVNNSQHLIMSDGEMIKPLTQGINQDKDLCLWGMAAIEAHGHSPINPQYEYYSGRILPTHPINLFWSYIKHSA